MSNAADLRDEHPGLPDGYDMSRQQVELAGGPWDCPSCGPEQSLLPYRCSRCQKDLVGEDT